MWKVITALLLSIGTAQADEVRAYAGSGSELDEIPTSQGGTPEYYLVAPGDTLWEIAQAFLGNPYYWPRLWSINDYITNPHWIYPGNRIVFRMGSLIEPPSVELETDRDGFNVDGLDFAEVEVECGPDIRFDHTIQADKYIAPAFLRSKRNLEIFGAITKAKSPGEMLSEDDLVYVKVEDPDAYECGDIVSVFRPVQKRVRHPKVRRQKYGNMYRILGELKVVHKYGEYLSATVRESYQEMVRGDLIGPAMPIVVELEVGRPTGDLEGQVVARMSQDRVLSTTGETVFIDRGRADGVRVGNSFYVISRQDDVVDPNRPDPSMPPSVIGRLVVVRVDDFSATAVVTDASRTIPIGAEIVTRMN
jgi:hypothetical protein